MATFNKSNISFYQYGENLDKIVLDRPIDQLADLTNQALTDTLQEATDYTDQASVDNAIIYAIALG